MKLNIVLLTVLTVLTVIIMSVLGAEIAYAIFNETGSVDWAALVDQIKKDPVVLESCSRELPNFKINAAKLLLKYSNVASLYDAELVVNYETLEGRHHIIADREGFYLNLVDSEYTGAPLFSQPIYQKIQHKDSFSKIMGLNATLLAVFTVIIMSVVSVEIAYAIFNETSSVDWVAFVDQIKKDPVVLESCSRELPNFKINAAKLLLRYSNVASLSDAKLVVNYEMINGRCHISASLAGREGFRINLSSNGRPNKLTTWEGNP